MNEAPKYIENKENADGFTEFKVNEKLLKEKALSEDMEKAIFNKVAQLNNNPNITDEQLANINKIIDESAQIFEKYIVGDANLQEYNEAISQILNGKKLKLKPIAHNAQLPSGRELSASEKALLNLTERNKKIKEKGPLKYAFGKIFN